MHKSTRLVLIAAILVASVPLHAASFSSPSRSFSSTSMSRSYTPSPSYASRPSYSYARPTVTYSRPIAPVTVPRPTYRAPVTVPVARPTIHTNTVYQGQSYPSWLPIYMMSTMGHHHDIDERVDCRRIREPNNRLRCYDANGRW